jgi:hypothetical protein
MQRKERATLHLRHHGHAKKVLVESSDDVFGTNRTEFPRLLLVLGAIRAWLLTGSPAEYQFPD